MNRCMLVAAALFDPHRTPPRLEVNERDTNGHPIDYTESCHWTPGQFYRLAADKVSFPRPLVPRRHGSKRTRLAAAMASES